jgi:exopolysaccharide biosynthesis polyprenyl glycosylphosphotransferase
MATAANTSSASLSAVDLPLITPAGCNRLASLLPGAEKILDFLTIAAAVYLSLGLYQMLQPSRVLSYGGSAVFLWVSFFALLFVFLMERHGGYRPSVSLLAIRETERILRVTLQAFLFAALAVYFCAAPVSRLAFCLTLVTVPLFLTLEKWEAARLLVRLRGKAYGSQRAVILGTGPEGRRVFSALLRSPKFGVDPIAFIDNDPHSGVTEIYESGYHTHHSAEVLSEPACPELFCRLGASVLIIATSAVERDSLLPMIAQASAAGVRTYFAPGDFLGPGHQLEFTELDGVMLAHLPGSTNRGTYDFAKRLLDTFVSMLLLLLLAPVAAIIALLVKTASPGPILFRQVRVGQGGRRFTMYKFRTMYPDAPHYEYSPGSGDDPRVTPLGRILRRTSLDELPQLVNVLLGQMSLVGPRPEMPFIAEQYDAALRQRLSVKPGMTGLWQIGPHRSLPIHHHPEYDAYYVRYRSIFMDAAILLHTLLFAGRGV